MPANRGASFLKEPSPAPAPTRIPCAHTTRDVQLSHLFRQFLSLGSRRRAAPCDAKWEPKAIAAR
jgi:hypothetical protein